MKLIKIAAIAALLVAPACMASQPSGPSKKSSWFSSFKADVKETVDDVKAAGERGKDHLRDAGLAKRTWGYTFRSFTDRVIESVSEELDSISLRYNTGNLRWNDTDCLVIEGILAATVLYIGYKLIRKATRKKHHDKHHKDD